MKKETKGKRIKKIRRIVTLAFIACVMSTCSVFSLGTSASSPSIKANAHITVSVLENSKGAYGSWNSNFKVKWKPVSGATAYIVKYQDYKSVNGIKVDETDWKVSEEIKARKNKSKYYFEDYAKISK